VSLPAGVDPRLPVIVGVGQHLDRDGGPEPVDLMVEALRLAETDSGVGGLLASAQVIGVVPVVSWRYHDPARLVAAAVGAEPSERWYPAMGGNTPQQLVTKAAGAIAAGECDVALVCGGESYRTRMSYRRKDGGRPDWPTQPETDLPTWGDGQALDMGHPVELALGVMLPTQCYPMFETALRHESGRSIDEHQRFLGELWAGYSRVAATNPYAWDGTEYTAEQIATPSGANRIIGYPYTKHMVSNPDVDMASGVILCSAEHADALGIDRDRWIFVWSGADGADPHLSVRPSLTTSPAMRIAGGTALDLAGVDVDDIAHVDVYSCFPSAVELATKELSLDTTGPLTVYGGLCFAGGPWNNPVGHAIASMVGVLRDDADSIGFVTANGGIVQKHAFGVYSAQPPRSGQFRSAHPQFAIDSAEERRQVVGDYIGPATMESWTVMHERDGSPSRAHATVLLDDGRRAWGVSNDGATMALLETDDIAGRAVEIGPDSALLI
jgi:acetyl-CoA C-acetyltransferase